MESTSKNRKVSKAANLGGVLVGTGLGFLAGRLPPTSPWSKVLVAISPTTTVLIPICFERIGNALARFSRKQKIRNLGKALDSFKKRCAEMLESPLTSPEHHDKIRGNMENVELAYLKLIREHFDAEANVILAANT